METGLSILKLSLCLSLVAVVSSAQAPRPWNPSMGMRPGACDHYECPTYKLVESGYGFEIRAYDSAVWMSTAPIAAPSMTQATQTGYQRLLSYIEGKNNGNLKMNMTSPVITQAAPPGNSVYTVYFYLSKKNQAKPPLANDLHVKPWKPTYVAVRQFSGHATDAAAKQELAALMDSLKGSQWIVSIEKSKGKSPEYLVADYNFPSITIARVNEILVPFDM